jgi:primosomal protein N' (replication factor Y)
MPYLEVAFNLPVRTTYTYSSEDTVSPGCRVKTSLGRRTLIGWVIGNPERPPEGIDTIRSITGVLDLQPLFDSSHLELARWLSELTMCSLGEALATMLPGGRRESRELADADDGPADTEITDLTAGQLEALKSISETPGGWFYLYGTTGSGKTEVFLRAARNALDEGRSVIYLVPEIALSHHLVEGFRRRFSGKLAVLHSGLTPSRRLTEWRRIQSGEASFVLGARSAVFAPLMKPGLIIIDEEHEGSYKSGSTPRYHARQVAMRRCRLTGARLLMGSATPSLEAWNLMSTGGIQRLELKGRPAGGAPPAVTVTDLRKEKGLFSRTLLESMSRVLGEGRQVLLFLNRRGFSYQYSCLSCGEEILCRHCSVPLTFHKKPGVMKCHYCGFSSPPPSFCPVCGSMEMRAAGFGTERIEEEVARLFPEKKAVRLDTDSTRRRGVLQDTLREFRNGGIDILLGTQMVAKGLNAPGVKLAAVLSADTTLNLPDFRSAERTFALIVQVSGRAGRFLPDGEVIVQTFRPDSPAIRLAAEHRVDEFYRQETEQRRMLGFPPFSRLFRVVFKGADEARVRSTADSLAALLAGAGDPGELMGHAECPIGRISGRYRRHLLLRSAHFDRTHAVLAYALEQLNPPHGVSLEIDIDPVNLL